MQVIMEKIYTDAELIDAYKKYGSQSKTGRELGVSQTTVYRALKRNGFIEGSRYVKCRYCGKLFLGKRIDSYYCSRKCKDISIRIKKGIPCNPNVEPYHKICVVCGKSYDSFRENSVTCSTECYRLRRNSYCKNGERKLRENTTEIWVNKKHDDSFEYVKHEKKKVWLKCKKCENTIERSISTVRRNNVECEYCKELKSLSDSRQKMVLFLSALKESKTPKTCVVCGKEFTSPYANKMYCSGECRGKRKKRGDSFRSRCRHYGVYYDSSVTRTKVIKRDAGVCKICGKVCNPKDLRWGSLGPDFPTVDHIIPLARGGAHTWDNVQCACAICNSNKRDLLEFAGGF